MLNRTAYSALLGLVAGAVMSTAAMADGHGKGVAYLIDSGKNPVMSASGCVLTPKTQKTLMFPACGDATDDDGDGVNNDKDKCPGTPKGVKVDANGCALDGDKDGVPDYQDKCPNNTAAEIAKGVNKSGPNIGCPTDSDGDGVPDYRDQCPGTPANTTVDVNGCASVNKEYHATVSDDGGQVYFSFDKTVIKPKGKQLLDNLVRFIKQRAAHVKYVKVEGHTDKVGPAAYNMKLSERRAQAVGNYLRSQGVDNAKIQEKGLGESNLKPTNAQSRRVEIKIGTTNK